MLVIAFPGLIVIAHHTDIFVDQREPLFEAMSAPGKWLGQLPDYQFDKAVII